MPKFEVIQHIRARIHQLVEAEDEEEASELAVNLHMLLKNASVLVREYEVCDEVYNNLDEWPKQ